MTLPGHADRVLLGILAGAWLVADVIGIVALVLLTRSGS